VVLLPALLAGITIWQKRSEASRARKFIYFCTVWAAAFLLIYYGSWDLLIIY
jgi:hypothetical protein